MNAMSAVGNNGSLYFIAKLDGFDGFKFFKALKEISQPYNNAVAAGKWAECATIIEKLLGGAQDYGIEFIRC